MYATTRRRLPVTIKLKIMAIITIICVVGVLAFYLFCDSEVTRDYIESDTQVYHNQSYKNNFDKLIKDVEDNKQTGIPTVDDAGIVYSDKIEITNGYGDFVNLDASWTNNVKSITEYNRWDWLGDSLQFAFAYSKTLHSECTLYERSGIVKVYDRYILGALGTYWAKAFGLSNVVGETFRFHMDNGVYYDVMCVDTKRTGDTDPNSLSINDPTGQYSIGHYKGSNQVCLTEFDIINFNVSTYPINPSYDGEKAKTPDMNYPELMELKDDPAHQYQSGSFNELPIYHGNVVAVEHINDPKAKELFRQAVIETNEYRKQGKWPVPE